MGARVIVDRRPAFEPAHRADEDVEPEDDAEGEHHEKKGEAVGQPPGGKLRHVESRIMVQQRVRHAVAHALPGERHLLPALRAPGADQQPEQRARSDGDREQDAGGERLAKLEVGHVTADLHRSDGAIDDEEVTDEPRRGQEKARQVQGQPEDVPVGEEIDRRGGDLRGPPAISQ